MYKIIDTHTHLDAKEMYFEREMIINNAKKHGVKKVINNADSIESFGIIASLAEEYPSFCYSAIGVFPCEYSEELQNDIDAVNYALDKTPNVVAIGEIGLDYYYSKEEEMKKKQRELFKAQIKIAEERGLPLIIHSREADEETFNILIESKFKGDITLHCYSGSYQLAERYLKNHPNTFFGIGGVLTFKNARRLVEVVEHIGLDHLLTETDAPYLAPVPYRGKRNEPSYLIEVIAKIAEIKKKGIDEVADILYANAQRVYKI